MRGIQKVLSGPFLARKELNEGGSMSCGGEGGGGWEHEPGRKVAAGGGLAMVRPV